LKVLAPALARQDVFRERFRREAQAAARLHHTNIVPVFGVGENAGTHYYAMQFIHGLGLDKVLREVQRLRRPGEATADRGGPGGSLAASAAHSLVTGRFQGPASAVAAATPADPRAGAVPGPDEQAPGRDTAAGAGSPEAVTRASGGHSDLAGQPEAQYF